MSDVDGPFIAMFIGAAAGGEYTVLLLNTNHSRGENLDQPAQFRNVKAQLLSAIQENLRTKFPDVQLLGAM